MNNNNDKRQQTLILVEGNHEKEVFISFILSLFAEIDINLDNVHIYGTEVYDLYSRIEHEYGEDWYDQDLSINIPYIISKRDNINPPLDYRNFSNILLFFDYERQAPSFDQTKIENLQNHFSNPSEDGLLLINYPMIESYLDMRTIPDSSFQNSKIAANYINGDQYKTQVKSYSRLHQIIKAYSAIHKKIKKSLNPENKKYCTKVIKSICESCNSYEVMNKTQEILSLYNVSQEKIDFLKHYLSSNLLKNFPLKDNITYWESIRESVYLVIESNLSKAWHIEKNKPFSETMDFSSMYETLDLTNLLSLQGIASQDRSSGYIWIICTAILFFCEYKCISQFRV